MSGLPPQCAWSEDEYLRLTDHSNRLIEFTDGRIEELPPPTFTHQSILWNTACIGAATPQPLRCSPTSPPK